MTVETKPAWADFVLQTIGEAGGEIQQIQLVRKAAACKGARNPGHYTAPNHIPKFSLALDGLLREKKISTLWVGRKKLFCLGNAPPENEESLPPEPKQNRKDRIAELEERLGRVEERLREISAWKAVLTERLERWRLRSPEVIAFLESRVSTAVSKQGREKTGG